MNPRECREYLGRLQQFGVKLGLENIATLLEALGRPHLGFPSVHVAGTNGKGSVAAMLEGILRAGGYRTGLYTSPHLAGVEERVRVDGQDIGGRTFRALLGRVRDAADGLTASGRLDYHPTYFEALTALAFCHFERRKVDIAVVETGLGGRFDATNVVVPLASVITTVARDHEPQLGTALRSIAFEKAGIIKPGVPVVCGVGAGPAFQEIRRRAVERAAPLIRALGPGRRLQTRRTARGYRFLYEGERASYAFTPALAGRHQGANAAVAIATAEVLGAIWRPVAKAAVLKGLREARWEGRLETVSARPRVVLDGAHNEEGARALAGYIREVLGRRVVLVFAALKDKDIRTMARLLFPRAETLILTGVPGERGAGPAEIAAAAPAFARRARLEPDVASAVRLALEASGGRVPVVIAGSLYLVGEVKRLGLFG
jgi:dihydrofolate synthase/folylpolyglutamate synthase